MTGVSSFHADVERASAATLVVSETLAPSLDFLKAFATSDGFPHCMDFDVENQRIRDITAAQAQVDQIVSGLLDGFAKRADRLYEKFDSMNDYTSFEALIACFSKRSAQERRAARISKWDLVQTLQNMLVEAEPLFALLSQQRAMGVMAQGSAEENIVRVIEKRKSTATLVENAHRRIKELNAQTAILQRKIAAATDETVRGKAAEDLAPLTAELEENDARERSVRADLDVLERSITTFETLMQSVNDLVACHTICLNKLGVETERCILLLCALGGSLPAPPAKGEVTHVDKLLALHAHNAVSLNDLERRKKRIDDAFTRRFKAAA